MIALLHELKPPSIRQELQIDFSIKLAASPNPGESTAFPLVQYLWHKKQNQFTIKVVNAVRAKDLFKRAVEEKIIGTDIKPPYQHMDDPDAELDMASKSGFSAYEYATRTGKQHPRLHQAVQGSPYEKLYKKHFNITSEAVVRERLGPSPVEAPPAPAKPKAPPAPARPAPARPVQPSKHPNPYIRPDKQPGPMPKPKACVESKAKKLFRTL